MSALNDCQNPRCVDGDAYRAEVSRLQARWYARNEALRALIEQWRSTAGVLSVHYDATGEGELRGRSKVYQIAADELERAIGGGDA